MCMFMLFAALIAGVVGKIIFSCPQSVGEEWTVKYVSFASNVGSDCRAITGDNWPHIRHNTQPTLSVSLQNVIKENGSNIGNVAT